jgi:hypothetical protein
MSLQSERLQLLMQRLGLTEMVRGYEALSEQAALPHHSQRQRLRALHPSAARSGRRGSRQPSQAGGRHSWR